jgi:hypothetical protein
MCQPVWIPDYYRSLHSIQKLLRSQSDDNSFRGSISQVTLQDNLGKYRSSLSSVISVDIWSYHLVFHFTMADATLAIS